MRSSLIVLLITAAASFAQDAKVDEMGKSPVETKFISGGRIRMELCSSGIQIVGTDEPAVRVSYHPERDEVRVRLQVSGDRADLRLTGCPHNNFHARIEIPKQSFVENQDVCENLTFNPWYSLPEHRPVGVMNRVRKPLYLEVARYRRTRNGQRPLCEPKNFDEIDPDSCEQQQNSN